MPTYAVDYPVASTPAAVAVLKAFLDSGRCEIGAHLHPWVNPPAEEEVNAFHSYACNLPAELMQRKLEVLPRRHRRAASAAPVVYKAGRYGIGPDTPAGAAQPRVTTPTPAWCRIRISPPTAARISAALPDSRS